MSHSNKNLGYKSYTSAMLREVSKKIEDDLPPSYYHITKTMKFGANTKWAFIIVMSLTSAAFGVFLWYFSTLTVTETVVSNTLLDGYDCSILSPLSGITYFSATTSENGQFRSAKLTSDQCVDLLTNLNVCDNTYDHISLYGAGPNNAKQDNIKVRNINGDSIIFVSNTDIIYNSASSSTLYAKKIIYGDSDAFIRPTVDVYTSSVAVNYIINGTSIIEDTDYTSLGGYLDDYDGSFYSLDSTEAKFTCINCESATVYYAPVVSFNSGGYYRSTGYTHWSFMYNKKLYGSEYVSNKIENIVEYDLVTSTSTTWATPLNLTDITYNRANRLKFFVDRVDDSNINFYMVKAAICGGSAQAACSVTSTMNDTFYEMDLQARSLQQYNNYPGFAFDEIHDGIYFYYTRAFVYDKTFYDAEFSKQIMLSSSNNYKVKETALSYPGNSPTVMFNIPDTDQIFIYSGTSGYASYVYDISSNTFEELNGTDDTVGYYPHMMMLAYTYGVCNNEITRGLVEVSSTLDYSIVCTSGMGYYYQSPNEFYAIPPECMTQQTLTNHSSFLSCPQIQTKLDELKASTCEASIEKICTASYDDNPPFSCSRQVGLNVFSIIGQASSNASICYTIASLIVMYIFNKYHAPGKKVNTEFSGDELPEVDIHPERHNE